MNRYYGWYEDHGDIESIRGNRKGVFTKDRQPKMVAHYLKEHWKRKN